MREHTKYLNSKVNLGLHHEALYTLIVHIKTLETLCPRVNDQNAQLH